jgi:thioredoxin 1
MVNFADLNDIEQIINEPLPVLVEFWSYDCLACNLASQFLMELDKVYVNKLKIVKVDIQKLPVLAIKYKIKSLPTFIMFKKTEIMFMIEGFGDKFYLEKSIRKCLK